jgi:hypothetical protein
MTKIGDSLLNWLLAETQPNANINGLLDPNLNSYKFLGVRKKMKHYQAFIWNIRNKANIANGVKLQKKLH